AWKCGAYMPKKIEEALAAWRDAERRLQNAVDGDRAALVGEVERSRSVFQQLSADHMMERMDALKKAEHRRKTAEPSTPSFHQAAKDEMVIATDIWDSARQSDEDTPQR
ncbi:MAG TPA: hypothetical protein VMZ33_04595, partial [Candidatus Limnocylindrales bacterium]|nr:hypothetical protein [Candidatus Limnocylindrales bacterium]